MVQKQIRLKIIRGATHVEMHCLPLEVVTTKIENRLKVKIVQTSATTFCNQND